MVTTAATPPDDIRFRLLGPVTAIVNGTSVALGGPRQIGVLARLLLSPGLVVSMDHLADALWDGDEPARPEVAIRSYISNLRRAVEPHRKGRMATSRFVSVAPGYRLVVDEESVDWVCFKDHVVFGQRLVSDLRYREALSEIRQAEELWLGEPCGGAPDSDVFNAHRTSLRELRAVAMELRFEAQLGLGDHRSVTAGIEAAVAESPYRERLVELGMVALYRAGRQSDALALGRSLADRLRGELGIDPGPAISGTEYRILNHDPSLSWPTTAGTTRGTGGTSPEVDAPSGGPEVTRPSGSEAFGDDPPPQAYAGDSTAAAALNDRPLSGSPLTATPFSDTPYPTGPIDHDHRTVVEDVLDRHHHGRGSLTVITGSYGQGKSDLIRTLVVAMEGAGALAARATAERRAPGDTRRLGVWSRLFGDLIVKLDEDRLAHLFERPELLPLAALGPIVAAKFGVGAADPDVDSDLIEVATSVGLVLGELAGSDGLILAFDDIHRADPDSVRLLAAVANSLSSFPVTLVAAWSRAGVIADEIQACLAALSMNPGAARVDLAPLRSGGVAQLARRLGVDLSAEAAEVLTLRSGGNPLLAGAMVLALGETDEPVEPAAALSPDLATSPRLVDAVTGYLDRLPGEMVETLSVASIFRRPYTAAELSMAASLGSETVEVTLALCRRLGVLNIHTNGGDRWQFRHPVVGDVLASRLDITERRRHHRSVGAALLDQGADRVEAAHHLTMGSDDDAQVAGLSLVLDAIDDDFTELDHGDVERIVRRALPTAERVTTADHLVCRSHLYLAWRSRVHSDIGEWRLWSRLGLETALGLNRLSGNVIDLTDDGIRERRSLLARATLNATGGGPFPPGPDRLSVDALGRDRAEQLLAEAIGRLGNHPAATACRIELAALRALDTGLDDDRAWRQAADQAYSLTMGTQPTTAAITKDPEGEGAEPGRPPVIVRACLERFGAAIPPGDRRQLLAWLRPGSPSEEIMTQRHWCNLLAEEADLEGASARLHPLVRKADGGFCELSNISARTLLVRHLLWIGDRAGARQVLAQTLALMDRIGLLTGLAVAEQVLELRRQEKNPAGFDLDLDHLDKATPSPLGVRAFAALAAALGRRFGAAGRFMTEAAQELAWDPTPAVVNAGALAWVAETSALVGGEAGEFAAQTVGPRLDRLRLDLVHSPGGEVLLGPAAYYAGLACLAGGDLEGATDRLAAAVDRCRELQAGPFEYRCWTGLGRAHQAQGDSAAAAEAEAEARQVADRLDARQARLKYLNLDPGSDTSDLLRPSN